MNPIGALIMLLAVLCIVAGIKGTQGQIKTAIGAAKPSSIAASKAPQIAGGSGGGTVRADSFQFAGLST